MTIIIKNGRHFKVPESVMEAQQQRLFTDDVENEAEEQRQVNKRK